MTTDDVKFPKQSDVKKLLRNNKAPSYAKLSDLTKDHIKLMRRHGADMGAQNQPDSASGSPSLIEVDATASFRQIGEVFYLWGADALEEEREIVSANVVTPEDLAFDIEVTRLRNDVSLFANQSTHQNNTLQERLDEQEGQLQWFRGHHNLADHYRYAPSLIPWAGALAAMAAVESVPNAPVFGEADALGFVGGLALAGSMGLANVFAGALTAFGVRDLKLKTWLQRTSGLGQVLVGVGGGVLLVLSATAYRYALNVDPAGAMELAAQIVMQSIIPPAVDVKTGGLVALSLGCAAGAYHATMLDWGAYPGYRRKAVGVDEAKRALERFRVRAIVQLEGLRSAALETLSKKVASIEIKVAAAKASLQRANIVVDRYAGWIATLSDVHAASLSAFWETNSTVRRQQPPPKHFGFVPSLNASALVVADQFYQMVEEAERALAYARRALQDAEAEIERIIQDALWDLGVHTYVAAPAPAALGGPGNGSGR